MNTTLVIAFAIPWIFWGILMGLLIAARRSWINMLLFPAGFTILIFTVARLSSTQEALWFSVISHVVILIFFLKSYLSFALKERKKNE